MEQKHKRQLTGTVVSAKMHNAVVVRVDRVTHHPKYHKRMVISSRFKARSAGSVREGDKVVIEETRPLSRDIRWMIKSRA